MTQQAYKATTGHETVYAAISAEWDEVRNLPPLKPNTDKMVRVERCSHCGAEWKGWRWYEDERNDGMLVERQGPARCCGKWDTAHPVASWRAEGLNGVSELRQGGCEFCIDAIEMDFTGCQVCGRGLPMPVPATREPRMPLFDGRGCGHPPDPIAERHDGAWTCHCGCLMDPADGMDIPEAPGPVVLCQKCGCHVAVPRA